MPVDDVCERHRQRRGQAEKPKLLHTPLANAADLPSPFVEFFEWHQGRFHAWSIASRTCARIQGSGDSGVPVAPLWGFRVAVMPPSRRGATLIGCRCVA